MFHIRGCVAFLFLWISVDFDFVSSRELVQIHTVTRHGERSPCFSYPDDPYRHLWTRSLGQMTDEGIRQLRDVGMFLRKEYNELIPEVFHKKVVHIRSSDTDRTIISAMSAMATLFTGQIVPVHSVPKSIDYELKMSSYCPRHKLLLSEEYNSDKYRMIKDRMAPFFTRLEKGTNLKNINLKVALRICDPVTIWHNLNLSLPNWLTPADVETCFFLGHLKFIISYSNKTLTAFRGGPLAHLIARNMATRVAGKDSMRFYGLFTHDSTISALLGHLGAFNQLKPPLASTIIVELYRNVDGNGVPSHFTVRLLLRNETNRDPYVLNMTECAHSGTVECTLEDFLARFRWPFRRTMPEECGVSRVSDLKYFEKLLVDDGQQTTFQFVEDAFPSDSDLRRHFTIPLLLTVVLVVFVLFRIYRRRSY